MYFGQKSPMKLHLAQKWKLDYSFILIRLLEKADAFTLAFSFNYDYIKLAAVLQFYQINK